MPHHPPHHHHPHHHHEWYVNDEKERSVIEIAEHLIAIGQKLKEKGECKINKSNVKPSNPSFFVIRYERMPGGELSLKLEITWDENSDSHVVTGGDLTIS